MKPLLLRTLFLTIGIGSLCFHSTTASAQATQSPDKHYDLSDTIALTIFAMLNTEPTTKRNIEMSPPTRDPIAGFSSCKSGANIKATRTTGSYAPTRYGTPR